MTASPDIFLSYNREDADVAKLFADAFAHEGMEVWWDVTLRSGETYDEVTEAALRGAKAVVVLWSPRSVASHWVRAEATIAHRAKTLVPATIEACEKPVMFELTQTADLCHWRGEAGDKAWQAFLGDVRRMVSKDAPEPAAQLDALAASAVSAGNAQTNVGMPVVAVLPIQTRGGGEEMEFLAEDLTEDITRELGQSFYCRVIATSTMSAWQGKSADHRALKRELSADYAVEGRMQGSGENVRLTVQLIDTNSDNMLWSTRFTCKRNETGETPEQFPLSVAVEIDQTIGRTEITRAQAKQPPCSAWEHIMRSHALMGVVQGNGRRAVEEARQAILAAPDFAMAHSTLAKALSSRLQTERLVIDDLDRRSIVGEARVAIKRAMELEGHSPIVLAHLANAYCHLGDPEAGRRLAQRATRLAPNAAEALYALGFSNFMLGRTTETVDALSKQGSIGLSGDSIVIWQSIVGISLFIEGKTDEAEVAIDKSLELQPNLYLSLRWKPIVAAELGKEETAKAAVRQLREAEPGKSIDEYLDSPKHLPIEHPRKYEAIEILRRLLEETEGSK